MYTLFSSLFFGSYGITIISNITLLVILLNQKYLTTAQANTSFKCFDMHTLHPPS